MTEKKKQHFVPRFYLKNFSLNAEGKKISLFNFAASKYVSCTNLYDQAYKNYFFGEDRIRLLVKQSSRLRRQTKVDIDKYLQKDTEGQRTMIMTHMSELSCSLSLSFISLVKKARRLSLGNKIVHLRDENFVRCYRNLNYDLDAMIADLQKKQAESGREV
jgi:hypothetical protein